MSLRKRPSSNSQMSLLNRALTSGTVSQRADDIMDESAVIAEKRGAVSQRAKKITQPGETSTPRADDIMDEIRSLGSYPREHGATRNLAIQPRRAQAAGEFSISQLEELKTLKEQHAKTLKEQHAELLMEEIKALGYIPKRTGEHVLLYYRWRKAVKSGKLTPEQIQAAEALTAAHAASLAQSMDPPPEACAPPDPLDAFAEEAANRLEQDLLMASSGMRTKQVMRRIRRYKKFFDEPALQENELVLQYKAQMDEASQTFTGCG